MIRKIPKTSTIRGRVDYYAYRAGFTLHRNFDGTCSLFDITMNYYTHHNVSMDTVVRVIVDELHMIAHSDNSPVVGA